MAAPTPVTRGTPSQKKLREGFVAKIAFARNTTIEFWEKTVKPPEVDGGDAIDQTTQFNTQYMTFAARKLIKLGDSTITAAYDPQCYTDIIGTLLNQEGAATWLFPDGSTLACYAYIAKFSPKELKIGEQPEAEITIKITNRDPVNDVEAAPVVSSVTGT